MNKRVERGLGAMGCVLAALGGAWIMTPSGGPMVPSVGCSDLPVSEPAPVDSSGDPEEEVLIQSNGLGGRMVTTAKLKPKGPSVVLEELPTDKLGYMDANLALAQCIGEHEGVDCWVAFKNSIECRSTLEQSLRVTLDTSRFGIKYASGRNTSVFAEDSIEFRSFSSVEEANTDLTSLCSFGARAIQDFDISMDLCDEDDSEEECDEKVYFAVSGEVVGDFVSNIPKADEAVKALRAMGLDVERTSEIGFQIGEFHVESWGGKDVPVFVVRGPDGLTDVDSVYGIEDVAERVR